MSEIPVSSRVLVIGGGPADSTAAILLARQGVEVTLLERSVFPRYHIGESLLPRSCRFSTCSVYARSSKLMDSNARKALTLNGGRKNGRSPFGKLRGNCTCAFQVVRSEFDHLLLEQARSQGVRVFEGVDVRGLTLEGERPRQARWVRGEAVMGGNAMPHRSTLTTRSMPPGAAVFCRTGACGAGVITRSSRTSPFGHTGKTPSGWPTAGKASSQSARSMTAGFGRSRCTTGR